jgi:hypothetical protein
VASVAAVVEVVDPLVSEACVVEVLVQRFNSCKKSLKSSK